MKKLTKRQSDELAKQFFGKRVEGRQTLVHRTYNSGAVTLEINQTYEDPFTFYPSANVYVVGSYVCTLKLINDEWQREFEEEE